MSLSIFPEKDENEEEVSIREQFNPDYRIAKAIDRSNLVKRAKENLENMIEHYYRQIEKAKENSSLGFSQTTYEMDQSRVAIWFYRNVEDWIRLMVGWDAAAFWSHMIFRGVFEEMQSLGFRPMRPSDWWTPKQKRQFRKKKLGLLSDIANANPDWLKPEEKLEMMSLVLAQKRDKRSDWTYFFYGFRDYFGRREWTIRYSHNWAFQWLYAGDEEWRQAFGEVLAEYTELACMVIISDLETGVFEQNMEGLDMENEIRASLIYNRVKTEMRNIDARRIMAGEETLFNLPIFGI
ncbi:MAG TPA: hypothetical protein VGS11_11890 [Candidatus Bathyarchaeia archaeon]|nr:hypothetical protein [Candidatus Bathyarchaeia archaeon]